MVLLRFSPAGRAGEREFAWKGAVAVAFTQEQLVRYSRHFVLTGVGVSGQKKLLASKVLVVGAGGLGSPALLYLAAAGIGTLGIMDDDTVDLSNLQRQIIHNTGTVGEEKVISAQKAIQAINPDVQVVLHRSKLTPDNAQEIIAQYDAVVDATDRFTAKFLINDACVLEKKPYVHAGVVRFAGQTMTYVPGRGPCLRCLMRSVPKHRGESCSQVGVMGSAIGVLGSIQALEVVKCLLGIGEPLTGRMLFFNGLNMEFDTVECAANPECPVCGAHPAIHSVAENRADYEEPEGGCCGGDPQA